MKAEYSILFHFLNYVLIKMKRVLYIKHNEFVL